MTKEQIQSRVEYIFDGVKIRNEEQPDVYSFNYPSFTAKQMKGLEAFANIIGISSSGLGLKITIKTNKKTFDSFIQFADDTTKKLNSKLSTKKQGFMLIAVDSDMNDSTDLYDALFCIGGNTDFLADIIVKSISKIYEDEH